MVAFTSVSEGVVTEETIRTTEQGSFHLLPQCLHSPRRVDVLHKSISKRPGQSSESDSCILCRFLAIAPFVSRPDPPHKGAAVWSSCSYDEVLNRIYVGLGNAAGGGGIPGPSYSNGVLSLDAEAGEIKGFFEPSNADTYRPGDGDQDMAGSPSLFTN